MVKVDTAKIEADPKATLKSCKARSVPFALWSPGGGCN